MLSNNIFNDTSGSIRTFLEGLNSAELEIGIISSICDIFDISGRERSRIKDLGGEGSVEFLKRDDPIVEGFRDEVRWAGRFTT